MTIFDYVNALHLTKDNWDVVFTIVLLGVVYWLFK
jgi:hypothetical protein